MNNNNDDTNKEKKVDFNIIVNESLKNNNFSFGNRKFWSRCLPLSCGKEYLSLSFTILVKISFFTFSIILFLMMNEKKKLKFASILIDSIFLIINLSLIIIISASDPGFFLPLPVENIKNIDSGKLILTQGKLSTKYLKICSTCNIVRNLRVFHCKICDLCILRHDHHCQWLGNCIGYGNHKQFIILLFLSLIHVVFVFVCLLLNLIKNFKTISKIFKMLWFLELGGLLILSILICILLFLQIFLISTNQTTSEYLRRDKMQKNSFDTKSVMKNVLEFFCCPLAYEERFEYSSYAKEKLSLNILISNMLMSKKNKNEKGTVEMTDISINKDELIDSDKS